MNAETSTLDLNPTVCDSIFNVVNSSSCNGLDELDLVYIKGLFNGSLELISYMIEFIVLNPAYLNLIAKQAPLSQAATNSNTSDKLNLIFSIELYINILRKFHSIYFNKHKLSQEQLKFVLKKKIKINLVT